MISNMNRPTTCTLENIVVINTTHIGTMLCNYPLLLRIRKKFAEAKITVLLCKRNGVLQKFLEEQAFSVIVLDNNFTGLERYKTIFQALLGKFGRYDLAISGLEPRKTEHLLLRALSPDCLAYGENNWHSRLIKHLIPFDKSVYETITQAQFCANVLDQEKIKPAEWPKLNRTKIPFPKLTLLIQSENNRNACLLSASKMAKLLNDANKAIPFNLIINSSKATNYSNDLKKALNFSSFEVRVTENFDEFVALINNVDACFLGEGGAGHVSAFTNTPALVLFGGTNATHWKPMTNAADILSDEISVENIDEHKILERLVILLQKASRERGVETSPSRTSSTLDEYI